MRASITKKVLDENSHVEDKKCVIKEKSFKFIKIHLIGNLRNMLT